MPRCDPANALQHCNFSDTFSGQALIHTAWLPCHV